MNSRQIQNIEPNAQQTISTYTTTLNNAQNLPNLNQSIISNNNQQITQVVTESRKIIQNENGTKTISEMEDKKYEINSVPFKSLMQDNNNINIQQESAFSSNHITQNINLLNNPFMNTNNIPNNTNTDIIISFNQEQINNSNNNLNNSNNNIYEKKNNSQILRKSMNSFPQDKKIFESKKIYKIETFKSHGKQRQSITNFNNILNNNNKLVLTKIIEENENYKLLIKRIALQLKRKIREPTHGFFYRYIKNEQYKILVKRIAWQLKRKTRVSTHGFFYKYIKNEQYKLLIKRIAFQLKRRRKLPTYKIIKIYESYVKLIKRIAHQLKISRLKRMGTKITTTVITEEIKINNGNINNINNNQINNDINYQKNIINNNLNQNLNSVSEINKTEIIQSSLNQVSNVNNVEKIDIEKEDRPKIYENENQKVFTFKNIENNNLNNDINIDIDIEDDKKESLITNNLKVNGDNFSFSQGSDKNQQILNEENENEKKIITEKVESTKKILTNQNNEHSPSRSIFSNISEIKSNNAIKVLNEGKISQSYPSSIKGNKDIDISLSVFKKENSNNKNNSLKCSEEKIVQNKTYTKEININNNNNSFNSNNDNEQDLNNSQDLNVSLSNIEVTKSNFIHDFNNFLNRVNIQIVNNYPVSLNEKNKHYFQQSNFWLLIMNYLFFQNNNISLYTIISLFEQYILWCNDINIENFSAVKERIIEYINNNYSSEALSQFLFMNKLKTIDEIFEKYQICTKNKNANYKEIKINSLNLSNDDKIKCNCELCRDDDACIRKVMKINNKRNNINNNINLNFISEKEVLPTYNQNLNNISNNEELFVKGISKKKQNFFSKSKTVVAENSNIEYLFHYNNNNINENLDEIIDDDNNKNYRNISKKKSKKNKKEEKNDSENETNKEEEKDEKKEDEKEENEKKDDSDSENKNKKKVKKTKKGKNKSRNKKKRDLSKSDKEENENEEKEEDEKKEDKEEEKKEERSKSKKKKKDKKKNKNSEKEEKEEKEEKNDSESKEEKIEDKDDEEDINVTPYSKRKKSKTPNKKKNKKH